MDRSIDRRFRLEERRLRHNGAEKGVRLSAYSVALMGRAHDGGTIGDSDEIETAAVSSIDTS